MIDKTTMTPAPVCGGDPFDVLFENNHLMMHSINKDGVLLRVSRNWAQTLGYNPDEMIGKKSIDFLTEESRTLARDTTIPRFIDTGITNLTPYDFVRKDGSALPILLSAVAVYDPDGAFVRSLAFIFDNSEATQAQRALEAKAQEAAEANATKSRFLASMSHEIRTPMNAILGFAHLLQRSELAPRDAKKVDAILGAGETLMSLLTDLLDLSKIEAGQMRIESEPFSLHHLLNDVRDWWSSSAADKGLQFHLSIDEDVPDEIISDDSRIRQILNNYLSNAIKFTSRGSVVFCASVKEPASPATADAPTAPSLTLSFEVEDTGIGLSEEQIAKLFKPFVRADTGFASRGGGWGLGLSICSQIAFLMGGRVGVTSTQGRGSTFFFDLPVAPVEADRETVDGPADAETPDVGEASILIAEDNTLNQVVLRDMLAALGHRAAVVNDGFEAVDAVTDATYDMVLMDIQMPGLDGIGATEQIRSLAGPQRDIPIVAVTANAGTAARDQYLALGMDDYLPKPISLESLAAVIARVKLAAGAG